MLPQVVCRRSLAGLSPALLHRTLAAATTQPTLRCFHRHGPCAPRLSPATEVRRTKSKAAPMKSVPIEDVSPANDEDSNYTLGQDAEMGVRDPPDSLLLDNGATFTHTLVSDVLRSKAKYGEVLLSVRASDSVSTALQQMNYYNIGAILVTADDDPAQIVGIFSTRDFVKQVDDNNDWVIDPKGTSVEEIMSRDPVFTYADTHALHSMNMMNAGGFRHLPVRDRATNRTIGLISIGDLVRTMMKDYQSKNTYLEDFVAGRYTA